jgi:hypothetical protein
MRIKAAHGGISPTAGEAVSFNFRSAIERYHDCWSVKKNPWQAVSCKISERPGQISPTAWKVKNICSILEGCPKLPRREELPRHAVFLHLPSDRGVLNYRSVKNKFRNAIGTLWTAKIWKVPDLVSLFFYSIFYFTYISQIKNWKIFANVFLIQTFCMTIVSESLSWVLKLQNESKVKESTQNLATLLKSWA